MSNKPRDKRVRLSLETKESVKEQIIAHGKDLGEWSLVGSLRRSVERSAALLALERRGSLVLIRSADGGAEDVEIS